MRLLKTASLARRAKSKWLRLTIESDRGLEVGGDRVGKHPARKLTWASILENIDGHSREIREAARRGTELTQ